MSELFDLERATINNYDSDQVADSTQLRSNLQEYWKQISEMLKAAWTIGDDVTLLRSRINVGNKAELQGLLEDLNIQIEEVEQLTSNLIESYEAPKTAYDDLWRARQGRAHEYDREGKSLPSLEV
jgi:hypothetical protein